MKKKVYLFLLFTSILWGQNAFDKGNEQYRNNQFEEAVKSYESILKSGNQSVELYYNLGNVYYKLNKIAPAIYNYERALLLNPNDTDVRNNLKFAQNRRIDDIKVIPKMGFPRLVHSFTTMIHYNTWAWAAVILSTFFLICFIVYYFTKTILLKRFFFASMCFVFLLILLSIGTAIFEKNTFDKEQPAIVFTEEAVVKEEPNKISSDAFTLHEGTKVYIIDVLENWNKIKIEDGSQGWITANSIKKLK